MLYERKDTDRNHDDQIHNESYTYHHDSPPFVAVEPSAAAWSPSPPAGVDEEEASYYQEHAPDCQPQRFSSSPWSQPLINSDNGHEAPLSALAENGNSKSAVRENGYAATGGGSSSPRTSSPSYCSHHHQHQVHRGHQEHQEIVPANVPHSYHQSHKVWHGHAQQWNHVHHPHSYHHQDAMSYEPYNYNTNNYYHPPPHHQHQDRRNAPTHDHCRNSWWPQQSTKRNYSVACPSSDIFNGASSAPPAKKKRRVKVANEEPRRPLSAYNFFFSEEKGVVVALLPEPPEITSDSESTEHGIITSTNHPKNIDDMSVEQIGEILDEASTQMSPIKIKTIRQNIETETQAILDIHIEGDREKKPHKKTHGKISFQKLASVIGNRWRRLSTDGKKRYFELAKVDRERFKTQQESDEKRSKSEVKCTLSSAGVYLN